MDNYTEGIAFILEGATEKVFYKAYLEYLSALDEKTSLIRNKLTDDGEIIFCWQSGEKKDSCQILCCWHHNADCSF